MPKNSKSLIALLLGVVIFAAAYFGAYGQYSNWSAAKDEYALSKEKNDKLKKAQADANAFMAKYESNRTKIEMANKVLPLGDPDTGILLGNLEQIAKESGFPGVKQINIMEERAEVEGEAAAQHAVKSVDAVMVVRGSYEAFNNFLLRMQRNLRLVDLVSVNITADEEDEGSSSGNDLEFTMNLRTYYQK